MPRNTKRREQRYTERADLILTTHGHDYHFGAEQLGLLIRTGAKAVAPVPVWFCLQEQGLLAKQLELMNVGDRSIVFDVRLTMTMA
ncbi:MAG TPA: hypothetical protein VK364_05235 [Hymenobacter sp.]|nr:hypothetical protein [Hymenobacter sp.]